MSERDDMLAKRAEVMAEHPEITEASELAPLMGEHEQAYWNWTIERFVASQPGGSSDRITRDNGIVTLSGLTGVAYNVTTLDALEENLRTCNVQADRDLLLDARTYLFETKSDVSDEELPGMWSNSDLSGGQTDVGEGEQ